ncbi:aspartate 1-decarboxylase [Candidatus Dojkabacteria bacterium]|jgi:aspartate 1-decarboxylase|nr:aspartate 1-decarboxylase [Candidatus Dojkabacteria bacterium]
MITKLKSIIHRAAIVNFTYDGSCVIPADLMEAANIQEYEQVYVYKVATGEIIISYAISGRSGFVAIPQGITVDDFPRGDVTICTYGRYDSESNYIPLSIIVDSENSPILI